MHRWEDNIKVNLKTAGWDGMDCIHVAVNSTMPSVQADQNLSTDCIRGYVII
jgi:hypothetical protein